MLTPPTAGGLHWLSSVHLMVQSCSPCHSAHTAPLSSLLHSASVEQLSLGCDLGSGGSLCDGAAFLGWQTLTVSDPTPSHDAVPPQASALALHWSVQAPSA